MRVALLGGTFNPPHLGHISIANAALDQIAIDRVLFIPTNIPAHKDPDTRISAQHRLNMMNLITDRVPKFETDDCEIRRGGISYSIETAADLIDRNPLSSKPVLIIGDDLLDGFHTWHRVDELVKIVELYVAHREFPGTKQFAYEHVYLENEIVPISSAQIRNRVASGQQISLYVPAEVEKYIRTNSLYVDSRKGHIPRSSAS